MDKPFVLINHAQQVVRERGIQIEWIERVIAPRSRLRETRWMLGWRITWGRYLNVVAEYFVLC